MNSKGNDIAEAVRAACIAAATDAWEDAGIQGLCGEGRWEVAIGALRNLDLSGLTDPADDQGETGSDAANG